MLSWLSRKWRWRAASLLVALYAFCLATPTAVLAFSPGAIPAHCLTDDHQDVGVMHVHEDGSAHHHSGGKSDDGDYASKCCGLFSVSAIAPDLAILPALYRPASRQPALAADSRTGRGSERIDRPPRSPQSL
ncbi:MAG TPA: hypothetical protein VFB31_15090 [Pseudolabrys sp.]|nr:hypothetical protein [Pseudolabrys sp.]